jgi:hypothetical protein
MTTTTIVIELICMEIYFFLEYIFCCGCFGYLHNEYSEDSSLFTSEKRYDNTILCAPW